MNPSFRTRPGILTHSADLRLAAGLLIAAAVIAGLVMQSNQRTAPGAEIAQLHRLAPAEIRSVALSVASVLERNFVSPETGRRYAAMLRMQAGQGAYDRYVDRRSLADALTADLQALAPDGHLRVFERWLPPLDRPPPGAPPAIEEARWLAPGIAYLRPTIFSGSAAEVAAIRRFLDDHAAARTLILDMRVHHGGGLAEMDEIFADLFAQRTRLAVLETRAGATPSPFRAGPRLLAAASPPGTNRLEHWAMPPPGGGRMRGARVYVLTSAVTGSAAEHFSFVLKRTHRATLIGARTFGAGNFGGLHAIPAGMSAFVPVGRTFDPDTDRGWEGIGVEPDVAVPPRRALVEALLRAGVAPAEAQRLSDSVEPLEAMEPQRAQAPPRPRA